MGEPATGCCPPMDLMRSEPMQLVQLIIPIESAHLAVSYLGELGLIQFKDVRDSYFSVVPVVLIVFGCRFLWECDVARVIVLSI